LQVNDFTSERAGRPQRQQSGYVAFIPSPLPPAIEFGRRLVGRLSAADRALGNLRGTGRLLRNPYLLIRPFEFREAVLSSRIEGTQASLSDLFFFEAAPAESDKATDVREVMNYVRALEHGLHAERALPLSLRLLREMHSILLEGTRGQEHTPGEFRRSQNWIGPPRVTLTDATFVPPPVHEMQAALDDLEKYLHKDDALPPLVRLAIIHYRFEAIHPFLDGNGRIGRLLIALLLSEWKLLDSPLLYLSAFFERRRQQYYASLLGVSLHGTWEDWIEFFLEGVESEANDAADRARRMTELRESLVKRVTALKGPGSLVALIDALMERPVITIPQAVTATGLSYQGAAWNVQRLVEMGILEKTTRARRPQTYYAPAVIELMDDGIVNNTPPTGGLASTRGDR
jgi:Fic family protein